MTDPSKPRYRVSGEPKRGPRRGKNRPLDLTPEPAWRGWAKSLAGIFFTAVLPTALLWWWNVTLSAYRVVFASPVTDVRLDGKPIRLGYRNAFSIPRVPLGDHRLQFRDAQGQEVELALSPRLTDNDATPLTIDGSAVKGVPQAERVSGD